jgi:hypothetical protein
MKNSDNMSDVKNFPFKKVMDSTAPGAIAAKDVEDSTPHAGTTAMPGKSTPANGAGNYRFSTTNAVVKAEEFAGAKKRAQDLQEGTNKSKLPDAAPPGGSRLKDGETETYQSGLIGTP